MQVNLKNLLPQKAMIGMVHVHALPGTPCADRSVVEVIKVAAEEAKALAKAGFDAIIIENMHDRPYLLRSVGPEITAAMTAVTLKIRQVVDCPLGVQILAGANREAVAVALAGGADFIRAEGFVFAHVADEGLMGTADAGELLRYRRAIGADQIAVMTDIKKKHSSHAVTADVDLAETARAAAFFGADGIVVTGSATGNPTSPGDLRGAKGAVVLPVFVGSGVTPDQLGAVWPVADGFIVGSAIKQEGVWSNPLDTQRMEALMDVAKQLRSGGAA